MNRIIAISREFGSGGRTIGKKVAEKWGIPCYDNELNEAYGKGIILKCDGRYLDVEFNEAGRESKFPYSACCYRHLRFEDGNCQKELDPVVEVWKEENYIAEKE